MTPDEILSAVYEAMEVSEVSHDGAERAREIIAAAIREAVAAERERCAKVAQQHELQLPNGASPPCKLERIVCYMMRSQIAARIREGNR